MSIRTLPRTRHLPATPKGGFARIRFALAVWRERQCLARLEPTRLDDLGLTEAQVRDEIGRPLWDVPQGWRR